MFKTRLISSIVLVVLALVVILTGGYLLAAVLLFLSLTAYRELMKACGLTEKGKPSRNCGLLSRNGLYKAGGRNASSCSDHDTDSLYVSVCAYFSEVPRRSDHELLFQRGLCAGHAVLHISGKDASLWELFRMDDLYQLLDL